MWKCENASNSFWLWLRTEDMTYKCATQPGLNCQVQPGT